MNVDTNRKRELRGTSLTATVERNTPYLRRLAEAFERADWMAAAACRGMNPETFFPVRGGVDHARKALRVCASCPVQVECRDHALATNEKDGIWGATTPKDRRRVKRGRTLRVVA